MASPHRIRQTKVEFGSALHRVFDLSWDIVQGEVFDTVSNLPISQRHHPVAGALWTAVSFKMLLSGSGTAGTAPPVGTLFKACGMKETDTGSDDTYVATGDPMTDSTPATIDVFIGSGLKLPISNAVGDMSIDFVAGAPAVCNFSMVGNYTAPTEAASAGSIDTAANPKSCVGLAATIGTKTLVLKRVTAFLGNGTSSPDMDICAANGCQDPIITDQAPGYTFDARFPAFATANYWTDFRAETKTALSVVLGATAGNICTVTGDGYMSAKPVMGEAGGILTISNSYRFGWGSTDTKFTMVFT